MRCSKCGAENSDSKRFCGDCGTALRNRCPACGVENPPGKRFCGDCGAALSTTVNGQTRIDRPAVSAATSPAEGVEPIEGERKTVTALFADIKGSTEMMEGLDPEEARAIIDPRSS